MKKFLTFLGLSFTVFASFAFDKQANIKDMYSDIHSQPVFIEESIFTLSDKNGKIIEEPTMRKTQRYYDWKSKSFTSIGYNDAGQPYLYEKVQFTNDELVKEYLRITEKGSISRRYAYNSDFSGYDVFTKINDGEEKRTSSFSMDVELDKIVSFEYTYNDKGAIAKTKKTVGYPYTGDLRQDAKTKETPEGTVYYYFYEDDKLASITQETDTESNHKLSFYVNNKKVRTETYTYNKANDVEKETTAAANYLYNYTYDNNNNWLQKDSYYEDRTDEIKYSRPLLRTKRTIQYNGSVSQPGIPQTMYAFDAAYSNQQTAATDSQTDSDAVASDDASKIPVSSSLKEPFTSIKHDPMDDKDTLYIVFNAPQHVNDYTESVSLVIRKKEGCKPEIYINWKEFLSQGPCYVTFRIDNDKARTEEWTMSTDEKASFYDGDTLELLIKLSKADQFIARTTPFNEPPCTAIFDISTLKNLPQKYNWLYKKDF